MVHICQIVLMLCEDDRTFTHLQKSSQFLAYKIYYFVHVDEFFNCIFMKEIDFIWMRSISIYGHEKHHNKSRNPKIWKSSNDDFAHPIVSKVDARALVRKSSNDDFITHPIVSAPSVAVRVTLACQAKSQHLQRVLCRVWSWRSHISNRGQRCRLTSKRGDFLHKNNEIILVPNFLRR